jgi:hypothetical protein
MPKFEDVVMLPVAVRLYRLSAPLFEIVLPVPDIVIAPAELVSDALVFTVRLPARLMLDAVLTEPETVRLFNAIPVPDMVLLVPLMVNVPLLCVKDP